MTVVSGLASAASDCVKSLIYQAKSTVFCAFLSVSAWHFLQISVEKGNFSLFFHVRCLVSSV